MVLESTGYAVLAAAGARAGLELFASHRADAVLLDYGMPEMNGGELATVMKEMKPDIPVVMLSALPSLPKDARSVDVFVSKGQSPEIWLDVLAAVIESRSPCPSGLSPFPAPAAA
jgi:CheY-like chemotaxis protein